LHGNGGTQLFEKVFSRSVGEAVKSQEGAGQKRSRTVKNEVIPEDKSLVNVLYICEVNNCGYNCEYPNKY
jgi:hypothetical protein